MHRYQKVLFAICLAPATLFGGPQVLVDGKGSATIVWSIHASRAISTLALADGILVAGGSGRQGRDLAADRPEDALLLCVEARSGLVQWSIRHKPVTDPLVGLKSQPLSGTPTIARGNVYYMSVSGCLVCVSLRAENLENRKILDAELSQYGIHTERANVLWIRDLPKEYGVHLASERDVGYTLSTPVVYGDDVFVVSGNGRTRGSFPSVIDPNAPSFLAFDADTGAEKWKRNDPGSNIVFMQFGSPIIAKLDPSEEVTIVMPGGDNNLYALDPNKGKLMWKIDCTLPAFKDKPRGSYQPFFVAPMALDHGRLFGSLSYDVLGIGRNFDGFAGAVFCIARQKPNRFEMVWRISEPTDGILGRIQAGKGKVYFAAKPDKIYCLSGETGAIIWKVALPVQLTVFPGVTLENNRLYVPDEDSILVINATNGEILRRYQVDRGISWYSTPVVSDDQLYFASNDGTLFCIREDNYH